MSKMECSLNVLNLASSQNGSHFSGKDEAMTLKTWPFVKKLFRKLEKIPPVTDTSELQKEHIVPEAKVKLIRDLMGEEGLYGLFWPVSMRTGAAQSLPVCLSISFCLAQLAILLRGQSLIGWVGRGYGNLPGSRNRELILSSKTTLTFTLKDEHTI